MWLDFDANVVFFDLTSPMFVLFYRTYIYDKQARQSF